MNDISLACALKLKNKTKIKLANGPIQEAIIKIGKLCSEITLLKNMNVTEVPQYVDRRGADLV